MQSVQFHQLLSPYPFGLFKALGTTAVGFGLSLPLSIYPAMADAVASEEVPGDCLLSS